MPTVPMKLPIDFLGRLNLEMNLLERLFGSHVARGRTQSRGGTTGEWPGVSRRLRRDGWGQTGSPWASQGTPFPRTWGEGVIREHLLGGNGL